MYDQYFANGTTALVAALNAFGCRDTLIAIPATICPSVPAAVLASGNKPYFVDIEWPEFGISPDHLNEIADKIGAVIAVHAYGLPCRILDIKEICDQHSIPLIEDCAQAEGAIIDGNPVGTIGDISVFSFGHGKILDLGGGGLARTSDETLNASLRKFSANLPACERSPAIDDLGTIFKFFYNNFYPDRLEPYQFMFPRLMAEAGARQLARADDELIDHIKSSHDGFSAAVAKRRSKAKLYEKLLVNRSDLEIFELSNQAVPWRFNIFLEPETRDAVLKIFLDSGRNVSSWYPSMVSFFGESTYPTTDLIDSDRLAAGILNLWLESSTSESEIRETCSLLTAVLDEVAAPFVIGDESRAN